MQILLLDSGNIITSNTFQNQIYFVFSFTVFLLKITYYCKHLILSSVS